MPKTAPPGDVKVPGISEPFSANAVPDAFDARDLEYRPRLQPLPPMLDVRPADKANFHVLTQEGNSCTGHAVAAMINNVLAQLEQLPDVTPLRVSPYMLYALPAAMTSSPVSRTRARRCVAR